MYGWQPGGRVREVTLSEVLHSDYPKVCGQLRKNPTCIVSRITGEVLPVCVERNSRIGHVELV
jgi:hypothetical protein